MRSTRRLGVLALCVGAALMLVSGAGIGTAGAQPPAPEGAPDGSIEVKFTPRTSSLPPGICLPPLLGMRHSTRITPTTFTLRVVVQAPLCSRVDAVAAIYGMPGNGQAWPQELKTTTPVSVREPGVTEVIFTRGCSPEQYDVIVGATPQVISPLGPWHGPLLFPFDPDSSFQSWRCGPPTTTTTTTTLPTTTTTTVLDNCEDYTPSGVAASPSSVLAGETLSVTGSGTPGTKIVVLLRPAGEDGHIAMADPVLVGTDGTWAASLAVPADATDGTYVVAAYADGCDTEVTTEVTVDPPGTTTTTPPTTAAPTTAGPTTAPPATDPGTDPDTDDPTDVDVDVLDTDAVRGGGSGSVNGSGSGASGASVAGASQSRPSGGSLAFTGSSAHAPLSIGVLLVAFGGLLMLRSRRGTRTA